MDSFARAYFLRKSLQNPKKYDKPRNALDEAVEKSNTDVIQTHTQAMDIDNEDEENKQEQTPDLDEESDIARIMKKRRMRKNED